MATLPPSVIYHSHPDGMGNVLHDSLAPSIGLRQSDIVEMASELLSGTVIIGTGDVSKGQRHVAFFDTSFAAQNLNTSRFFARGAKPEWIIDAGLHRTLLMPTSTLLPKAWLARLDRIISELGRLKAGWDGAGSRPLPHSMLVQIETALAVLPSETQEPDVEVDGSDNSVTFRWWASGEETAFAMTFTGNGKVHGVTSSTLMTPPPAWHCSVNEDTKLLDRIDHPMIRNALTGSS